MVGTTVKSAWPIASMTVRGYCKCGAAIHTTSNNPDTISYVMETFAEDHHGEGHGACDAKTARKARKKMERQHGA